MLKWYAETFKLTEKQMTVKALRRIKILTVMSFIAVPLTWALKTNALPSVFDGPLLVGVVITLACFFCLCFTKFVNRFWARDKYLDEWERSRKHQSMAFAFQVLYYALGSILVFGVMSDVLGYGQAITVPSFGLYTLGVIAAAIVMSGLMVMHLYLLATTKPIDEDGAMPDDVAPNEVI